MKYGNEKFGRLKTVMLHNPKKSLKLINDKNFKKYLFDNVPNIPKFLDEHDRYRKLLESYGIEVLELSDYVKNTELLNKHPNQVYVHDSSVITSKGAFLSAMAFFGRKNENLVIKEALTNLNIPIFSERTKEEIFEGFLPFSKNIAIVADTERHNSLGINSFFKDALKIFKEVIHLKIPKERDFMHHDMIIGRLKKDLLLCYMDAIKKAEVIRKNERFDINFEKYMFDKKIDIIPVSKNEQQKWATSFVPLESGTIFNYDISLSKDTQAKLKDRGVEVISFSPKSILTGCGSLNCITLQLYRE